MSRSTTILLSVSAVAAAALLAPSALAQQGGGDGNGSGSGSGPITVGGGSGQPTTIVVQPNTTTTTTATSPPGYPQPGTNINAGLPSGSQPVTNTNGPGDTFDLNKGSSGGGTVYGGKNASADISFASPTGRVPEIHTVRRGDTLWDLCGTYYNNPYDWPKVWSYNPQIQNPHWIYPGDQIRMREPGSAQRSTLASLHGLTGQGPYGIGLQGGPASTLPPQTVFLRDQGFIADPSKDTWGDIVGSREDQMLLSFGNHVYMKLKPGKKVVPGQYLTVYRPIRVPKNIKGARRPPGQVIAIKGTVKVDQWNPKTRIARGVITESLDTIERGAKVGPVGRRFDVVEPRVNTKTVWARVLTSVYPHIYLGQNQVAFIDKGSADGLHPGNRLFIVRRGDAWRQSLKTASDSARQRVRMDDPRTAPIEPTPTAGNQKDFPEEVIGELRVLRTRRYTSACLVTVSHREIVPGDRAVARKGY